MIPFNNLKPLHNRLAGEINAAVQRVVDSGWYILGPEVESFEAAFASYHGVAHAVGVANGTDAIELAIRAASIGPDDEVITVAHTAVATVCAIELAGARPVLVDIDPRTYTMDPAAAEAAITPRTKALLPVHIYGQTADLAALVDIADRHGLLLIEDCAQAHGARFQGRLAGSFGDMAAFSFYPTKNLGAYGDGGMVITGDAGLAERLRRLRNYGQTSRYIHQSRGLNSRLDPLQAAILAVKLPHLEHLNIERRDLAGIYDQHLNHVIIPWANPDCYHVYHLYVIRSPKRDQLMAQLKQNGIETLIHYPVPIHLQEAYADLGYPRGSLPVTEQIAGEILSLPLYIGLEPDQVEYIAQTVSRISEKLLNE